MVLIYVLDNISNFDTNCNNTRVAILTIFIFCVAQFIFTIIELRFILPQYTPDNLLGVTEIENMDGEFLPVYLGYFFVALGLDNIYVAMGLFLIVWIFVSYTRVQYYNPVFLFYNYHFFRVKTEDGIMVFLITKRDLRINEKLNFENLGRINDYVYFDKER